MRMRLFGLRYQVSPVISETPANSPACHAFHCFPPSYHDNNSTLEKCLEILCVVFEIWFLSGVLMRFLLSIDLKLPVVVCGGVGKVAEGVGWDVQMKEGIILCSIDYLLRSVFLCINHLPMLSRKKMIFMLLINYASSTPYVFHLPLS